VRKISDFNLRCLVKIAWSFAQLLIPHKPLLQAIASPALPMCSEFSVQECENMAWAFSALYFRYEEALSVSSAQVLAHVGEVNAVDLTSLSWAYARLRLKADELRTSISASAIANIAELSPQGFANLAWSNSVLSCRDKPLRDAISSEAVRKLSAFRAEAQYMVMVADAGLPCSGFFIDALDTLIDSVFGSSLPLLDAWPQSGLLPFFKEQPLRSLGIAGTRLLFRRMNLQEASDSFCKEAIDRITAAQTLILQPPADKIHGDLLVEKTWSFARFDLAIAMGPGCSGRQCRGEALKDNGFKNAQMSPFLQPAKMSIYEWVDRAQCAEYQLLAEILTALGSHVDLRDPNARAAVHGLLEVYILSAPCLSCVSCFRQIQKLLPRVEVHIGVGVEAFRMRV